MVGGGVGERGVRRSLFSSMLLVPLGGFDIDEGEPGAAVSTRTSGDPESMFDGGEFEKL